MQHCQSIFQSILLHLIRSQSPDLDTWLVISTSTLEDDACHFDPLEFNAPFLREHS